MKNKEDLKKELIKIDHKSYGMYKTLGGSYSFGNYILYIDHVQGDPFASPSRLHFEVKRDRHGFPEEYYQEKHRRLALEDQVLRRFLYELRQIVQRTRQCKKGLQLYFPKRKWNFVLRWDFQQEEERFWQKRCRS